jgi:hypothetical protein
MMTAPPPIQVVAVVSQIREIVRFAQKYDCALTIRAALRDALVSLERAPERREPIRFAPPGGAQ